MPAFPSNPRPPDDDSLVQGKNWFSKKIESLIAGITPNCTETTRLLSRGLDHQLPFLIRLRIRLHFVICTYCARYAAQLGFLRNLASEFHHHSHDIQGPNLPPEVREQIRQALRQSENM
jgi:hypothetical protein